MIEIRGHVAVPVFTLIETCEAHDPRAIKRNVAQWKGREAFSYHLRPVIEEVTQRGFNYNLFPIVLDRHGIPWGLATNFLLSKLEAQARPNMRSYASRADDLAAFRQWLDEHSNPNELLIRFPKIKFARPTYRYSAHLEGALRRKEMSRSTAQRRMGTVIALYRWMVDQLLFEPEYPLWGEREYLLTTKNREGFSMNKAVVSTDVSIKAPRTDDPFEGVIHDGAKLRPLSGAEQEWIIEATRQLGNPEMHLLILFMLLTGARIQTACTLRLRHFTAPNPRFSKSLAGSYEVYKLMVGPSAGIDTKYDKQMVLQVPRALFEVMRTYAESRRARRRRELAANPNHPDQHLFLTQQGSPYYTSKEEAATFDPNLKRRHQKTGGTVRQFLKEHLIPYVRNHHNKDFQFRVHDLRASYGMNQSDLLTALVEKRAITVSQARNTLMALMGHDSSATTDRYLDFRKLQAQVYAAIDGYGEQVQAWIDDAMVGIGYNDE